MGDLLQNPYGLNNNNNLIANYPNQAQIPSKTGFNIGLPSNGVQFTNTSYSVSPLNNGNSYNQQFGTFSKLFSNGQTYKFNPYIENDFKITADPTKNLTAESPVGSLNATSGAKNVNPDDAAKNSWSSPANILSGINTFLNGLSAIAAYKNGKKQLALAEEALEDQRNQFNESYNNILKQYNTALADRLRARAAFETGDSTAYNDEIAANSMRRGETGNSSAGYLNYSRSSAADNPYNRYASSSGSTTTTKKEGE